MARTKHKKAARSSTVATTSSSPSVASLLSKAQDLIVQCDYTLARQFTERVLAREDATVAEKNQAKEMFAIVLLEMGDVERAKQIFVTLVPPHPNAPSPPPASAYLYLAQLTDDDPHAALGHYQSAIDILQTQLKGKPPSSNNISGEDEAEIKGNLIRAYLGMVEIWMDPVCDLCLDPTASSTCDSLLSEALKIDPQNLEALQTLASVRLSQEKSEEALQALLTFPPPPAQDSADGDPQSYTLLLLNALPIQTRIARAKLLLECGAYPDALSLLEGVLAADDTNVEGWYIMGWAWWLLAERKRDGDVSSGVELGEEGQQLEWQDMARDARDCLETCQTLHTTQEHPDIQLLEHVRELIGTLDALGIQPSPVEEDGNDEEWEEVSDDEEEEDIEMA